MSAVLPCLQETCDDPIVCESDVVEARKRLASDISLAKDLLYVLGNSVVEQNRTLAAFIQRLSAQGISDANGGLALLARRLDLASITMKQPDSAQVAATVPAAPPNPEDFWMVFIDGASAPTCKHESEEAARKEVERLAEKFPGKKVHVLRRVATLAPKEPVMVWS